VAEHKVLKDGLLPAMRPAGFPLPAGRFLVEAGLAEKSVVYSVTAPSLLLHKRLRGPLITLPDLRERLIEEYDLTYSVPLLEWYCRYDMIPALWLRTQYVVWSPQIPQIAEILRHKRKRLNP
jgi:hypothetical protein